MTTTVAIGIDETSGYRSEFLLALDPTAKVSSPEVPGRLPVFIPRNQDYFWTTKWQQGEMEALREIQNGEARRFSSGAAAAEWLLSDDD